MRKFWIAILVLLASCFLFGSCMSGGGCAGTPTESGNSESVVTELEAPVSLKMDSKGTLSWAAVENATAYEVAVGSATVTTDKTKIDLTELVTSAGSYTVSVTAKTDAISSETATYSFTAVKLSTPSKPEIEIDPETHAVKFVWTAGNDARSYLQQVNGGKWVTNTAGYFEVNSTGSYTIAVKSKAYAANNVLYLESDASELSETYEHQQGPSLALEGMTVVGWTVEDGVEFDCFNLWINGELARENVELTDGLYSLFEGEDPVITKTGEYDVQVEAIKDGKSYWSNLLKEVGTYNINPGELHSFDNRIAKFPVIKDGVSISNEQYHGESGYSLRFEAQHSEQLNLINYFAEGHKNDIDNLTIKKISYWVYVEPIYGYEGDFPASCIPAVKWEKEWTFVDKDTGAETKSYKSCAFRPTEDIPFGQWVKIELDNVQMAYENIVILSYTKTLEDNYVIYIDDIYVEEFYEEVNVADAEYSVQYSPSANYMGSWFGYEYTPVDFGVENANKTLTVSVEVCGNAIADLGSSSVGIFNVFVPDRDVVSGEYEFIYIDSAKISSLDNWSKVVLQLRTNAEGKCYLTGMYDRDADAVDPFNIFFKNFTVIDIENVGGTEMPAGEMKPDDNHNKKYYQSFVGLTTDLSAGTFVQVDLDVYVTGVFDAYTYIAWVDTLWTTEGGEVNNAPTLVDYEAMEAKAGEWIHLSFYAFVRDFDTLRLNSGYSTIDVSSYGNAVFLEAASFLSSASFNYKNVVITAAEDVVGSAMPTGTAKVEGSDYYQAFAGLTTDLAAGSKVSVTMDVYVNGSYDEYSSIKWVDSVWTKEGGEVNVDPTIVDYDTMVASEGEWISVTFEATVRDFDVLRMNPAYPMVDVSSYGNAVFLLAENFLGDASFNYKNVTITDITPVVEGTAMPEAEEKTAGGGYYQSFVGLSTDYDAGTFVQVDMDIYVTGEMDSNTYISWVDTVWTAEGGEVKKAPKIATYEMMSEGAGNWMHVTFYAFVRDFDVLRLTQEFETMDVSAAGNGVFLAATYFKSTYTFNYDNVVITAAEDVVGKSALSGEKKIEPDNYYQAFAGLSTDYAAGTKVSVSMEVYVTGSYDEYSSIKWVDTVWSVDGGEVNETTDIVDYNTMSANEGKWISVEFEAYVRDFDVLRLNPAFATMDVSPYGNAVFLVAQSFLSAESFQYKNVVITMMEEPDVPNPTPDPEVGGTAVPAGTTKTDETSGYHQAFVGLPTEYEAGTFVKVDMDIYVTGEMDSNVYVSWVNTVWTVDGGEVNKAPKIATYETMNEGVGNWMHVTFYAYVRDFDTLRMNPAYPVVDVSEYGKAVFLEAANFLSANSFNYDNVVISAGEDVAGKAATEGATKTDETSGYRQAFAGLSTELAAGTKVSVSVDLYIGGEHDEYAYISWVDTVWSTSGGEVNEDTDIVSSAAMDENAGKWFTVTFEATVRDFDVLRLNPAYSITDVSEYGNAVFLVAANFLSVESFNYKNVVITMLEEPDVPDPTPDPEVGGTAVSAGAQKIENADGYYQAFVGLSTDYEVGTLVQVDMDIYVTGEMDNNTYISWVNTVWSVEGGEVNKAPKIATYATMSESAGNWMHVTFYAYVRNFSVLRLTQQYATMDVSATGNGVFLAATYFKGESSFNYDNVVISAGEDVVGNSALNGEKKITPDNYYQAFAGLSTEYEAGTKVSVSMEIYVSGSYDEYSSIKWVDTVWSVDGGEVNETTDIVDYNTMSENTGKWISVEFEAYVRDFDVLRLNPAFATMDVSAYGNAVFLVAQSFLSVESFNYKNVEITMLEEPDVPDPTPDPEPEEPEAPEVGGTAVSAGAQKIENADGYYQAFVGLSTEYEVGTLVQVDMDIYVTGEIDSNTYISWVNTVWSVDGGEVNKAPKIATYATMSESAGNWMHVTFYAYVRNFSVLRLTQQYATMDVSATGNGVFLAATYFKGESSFNYDNVVISAGEDVAGKAATEGATKTGETSGYRQAFAGLSTELAVGTKVSVSVDLYIGGEHDEYAYISWVDTVWSTSGGEVNEDTDIVSSAAMDENAGKWFTVTFEATVRDFDVLRLNPAYSITDVSEYGNAVFLVAANFLSEESFNYKNVVITALEEPEPETPVIDGTAMPMGTEKTQNANGYYQAFAGLSMDYPAGAVVTVTMDIYVTGTIDDASSIRWVDTVWSTSGGEVNSAPVVADYQTISANAGKWFTVEFNAIVKDYDVLRTGVEYATQDVSEYGNAVFLYARNFKSAESFNYKNVVITAEDPGEAVPDGTKKANGYYQAFVGLSTDYAVGTTVTVTMEVYVTGTIDSASSIRWVDTVWSNDATNSAPTIVDNATLTGNAGQWISVTFTATVRSFTQLRLDAEFELMDVSSYGNAVYLMARNFKSAGSFNYRNVVITAA